MSTFLAIDFETANTQADSACALGLVRVEGGEIVRQEVHLIRPPSSYFQFTYIHGITWQQVSSAPTFGELWPKIAPLFDSIDFVAAHNVAFDSRVLRTCCDRYEIDFPERQYLCSVQMARDAWNLYPTKLPDVCKHLGLNLNHHEALSDAIACAKIVIAAATELAPIQTAMEFGPSF